MSTGACGCPRGTSGRRAWRVLGESEATTHCTECNRLSRAEVTAADCAAQGNKSLTRAEGVQGHDTLQIVQCRATKKRLC